MSDHGLDKFSFRKPVPESDFSDSRKPAASPADKSNQPAAHQPHIQPPSYAPMQAAPPAPAPLPRVSPNAPKTAAEEAEETVEIPALFRKKMM